jgi:hypothetical protein
MISFRSARLRALFVATVAAGALAGSALACGDDWMALNLVATPGVKAGLRAAYLAAHPELASASVGAPVSGRTYYGSFSGTRYAVATFAVVGRAADPTIFRTDRRGRWQVRRETHGGVCTDVVPSDLIKIWWLEHWRGRCYVEPR